MEIKYYAKKKENSASKSTSNYYSTANTVHTDTADYANEAEHATESSKLSNQHKLWGQTFDGTQDVNGDITTSGNLSVDGTTILNDKLTVNEEASMQSISSDSIIPNVNEDSDLGSTVKRWLNGYVKNVYSEKITNSDSITTKDLTVTGSAHFFELIIDKVKAAGGAVLFTPADGFNVDIVETVELAPEEAEDVPMVMSIDSEEAEEEIEQEIAIQGYKLYWQARDNNGNQRDNMWEVGDQALCKSFNQAKVGTSYNTNNKNYWCLVTEVSSSAVLKNGIYYNYIVISTIDKTGTVNPEIGDSIVMCGNRTNEDRQTAIYISAYTSLDTGLKAPLFAQYKGINDFNLASHRQSYFDANKAVFIGDFKVSSDKTIQDYVDDKEAQISLTATNYTNNEIKKAGIEIDAETGNTFTGNVRATDFDVITTNNETALSITTAGAAGLTNLDLYNSRIITRMPNDPEDENQQESGDELITYKDLPVMIAHFQGKTFLINMTELGTLPTEVKGYSTMTVSGTGTVTFNKQVYYYYGNMYYNNVAHTIISGNGTDVELWYKVSNYDGAFLYHTGENNTGHQFVLSGNVDSAYGESAVPYDIYQKYIMRNGTLTAQNTYIMIGYSISYDDRLNVYSTSNNKYMYHITNYTNVNVPENVKLYPGYTKLGMSDEYNDITGIYTVYAVTYLSSGTNNNVDNYTFTKQTGPTSIIPKDGETDAYVSTFEQSLN